MLKPSGLFTFQNHLSGVPTGALLKATNVNINRDSIVESRRGFKVYGTQISDGSAHQLMNYKLRILRHFGAGPGTTLEYDSNGLGNFLPFTLSLMGDTTISTPTVSNILSTSQLFTGMFVSGSGIPSNTTIIAIVDNNTITLSNNAMTTVTGGTLVFTFNIQEVVQGVRIKSIEQNGNLYFTTNEGIKKISALDASQFSNTTITNAGGVKSLDIKLDINNSAGFFLNNNVLGYRVVWGIKDANSNLILGAPSQRAVILNTTGSAVTVDVTIPIPREITTAYFFQIYRTGLVSTVSTFNFVGDTASTTTISNISDTSSLEAGMSITGTGILPGTTITSISSTTSIEISQAATATNTGVNFTIFQILNQDPGDEEQLVYEANPSISDLNNGFIVVNDITPDSFRGANLYTNENTGEGILKANDVPPLALDINTYKNYTFYANTRTKQRLDISLLSISQLVSGVSTITITDGITSNTYTFKTQVISCTTHSNTLVDGIASTSTLIAGQSISGADFALGTYIVRIIDANSIQISQAATASSSTTFTAGYESASLKYIELSQFNSVGQQVDETAQSLIRVINRQDTEVVYAYSISAIGSIPGEILLESRKLNQSIVTLTTNDPITTGIEFSPNIPVAGLTTSNEVSPNRIYYSKVQQPEAVPLLNYLDIGPKDKQIIRIIGLRDSLIILKEEGIYRLSGFVDPFQLYPLDFSTIIKASDSAVVLNNLIYVFTNQGVATVSDSGVNIISRPIEDQIIKLLTTQYTNFTTATFGLSYESDRAYYLSTVTNTSDIYATQCFRFNTFTQTWTNYDLSKRSGIVNFADDKIYLGATDINFLEQERKLFDRTDLADREYPLTLAVDSVSGTTISSLSLTNIAVYDVIVQTQYLTISQFNRILTKLDRDSLLTDKNYSSTLISSSGVTLNDSLDLLIIKVANDTGRLAQPGATLAATYTALTPTSSTFSTMQTAFNSFIALLNTDTGLFYSNYLTSSGTVDYEFPVLTVVVNNNTITTNYEYPLIAGPMTLYKHIETELQFVPQTLSDTSITKQASEGTFIFEDSSFTSIISSYSSDLSADFEEIMINGNGAGLFGTNIYGNGIYGGNGTGIPFRTYIPREKQRCRYINARMQHFFAREIFSLYGLSISFNPTSTRGWR